MREELSFVESGFREVSLYGGGGYQAKSTVGRSISYRTLQTYYRAVILLRAYLLQISVEAIWNHPYHLLHHHPMSQVQFKCLAEVDAVVLITVLRGVNDRCCMSRIMQRKKILR